MVEDVVRSPDEEARQTPFSKVGWISRALILVLILMFWYATSLTSPVPNKSYTNVTNPITNTTTSTAHIKYIETDIVPSGSVEPTYALFGSVLVILLVYTLIKLDLKPKKYITIKEAEQMLRKEITRWQRDDMLPRGSITVNPDMKLVYVTVNDQRIAIKYVIDVLIQNDENKLDEYYRAEVDAKNEEGTGRYVIGFIKSDKPLDRDDICGKCGSHSDVRIITSKQFQDFRRIKQEMGVR